MVRVAIREPSGALGLILHESAADRIVGLGKKRIVVVVENAEHQAVGVTSKCGSEVENHIADRVEGDAMAIGQINSATTRYFGKDCLNAVRIDGVGSFSSQAQDHGAIGSMSLAGEGEGAMEAYIQPSGEGQRGGGRKLKKAPGRHHREDVPPSLRRRGVVRSGWRRAGVAGLGAGRTTDRL